MAEQYSFISKWKIRAPLPKVWDAIYDSQDWPIWWDGVAEVKIIKPGDIDGVGGVRQYTWKSILPYSLSFTMQLIEIDKYKRMKGMASGELQGVGEWFFEESDGITSIQYNWDVKTTLSWMNKVAFIMKPLFKFSHNLIMKWGAKGLAKKLDAQLIVN